MPTCKRSYRMRCNTHILDSRFRGNDVMGLRWLLVIFIALLLFSFLHKWLEKIGLGKLPGDFRFRLFGREFFIPLTSSVLLSLVAMGIARLL
jgi:hypothetical protein